MSDQPPHNAALGADVLVRLRSLLSSLQPAERRVAELVIKDPDAAAQLSITDLASGASTSVATVTRFSRRAGFAGYPQLRLALAGAAARERVLGASMHQPPTDLDENATLADVVASITHHEVRALQDTAEHVDLDALQRAIDAVDQSERTDIFGIGASGSVGLDLQQKLHRIGRNAYAWNEFHSSMTAAALMGTGRVAIGISHTGQTIDTVEPLALAHDLGAITIAVTGDTHSPLARQADIVLTTAARETAFRSGASASRTAQLAIVDFLFVGVARSSLEESTEALARTYEALAGRRSARHPVRRSTRG
ncbi:MurR/RpiR family transcriptional regulator [Leekyejoonella antrihumi]|uniref:MurR/RpiR family transcriptional regulator n=1 Tax=Leekyejoonella antrihumi TaxID=1660198 RepID=A0A563E1G3_9MICO|nr:MurR/RpiR family transcriptional regulator [Leekyejoonella antrihumi]TWP36357.1 MurR/RpiR family transcriptional regulator [Leekyejoonella antrihumi]